MGREQGPMCHYGGYGRRSLAAVAPPPPAPEGGEEYWKCSEAVDESCHQFRHDHGAHRRYRMAFLARLRAHTDGCCGSDGCVSCASSSSGVKAAGCTPSFIDHACSADFTSCEMALKGKPHDYLMGSALRPTFPEGSKRCSLCGQMSALSTSPRARTPAPPVR